MYVVSVLTHQFAEYLIKSKTKVPVFDLSSIIHIYGKVNALSVDNVIVLIYLTWFYLRKWECAYIVLHVRFNVILQFVGGKIFFHDIFTVWKNEVIIMHQSAIIINNLLTGTNSCMKFPQSKDSNLHWKVVRVSESS